MELLKVKEQIPKDLEELLRLLETEYTFEKVPAGLRQVTFDKEGYIGNGTQYKLTEWSFERLLHLLRIPVKFAVRVCPDDLTETIVNRLKQVEDIPVHLLVRDNTLVSIVPQDYNPPEPKYVVELLNPSQCALIRVSDKGLKLASITELGVEPKEGDPTRIGHYLVASETGGRTKVSLMLYRVICGNGAVVGDEFGSVAWRSRRNGDEFRLGLQVLVSRAEELKSCLSSLARKRFTDLEFRSVFRSLRNIVGRETALLLVKDAEESTVSQIMAQARLKQRRHEEPEPTDISVYELYNEITQFARDLTGEPHRELMRLAGRLIRLGR